ncbi:MAG: cupin domain-containing protein [Candidatus Binatia bacterium]
MSKHKNVINLSAVPIEQMKTPDGSAFGGMRQRIGTAIGARKLGYSFFTVPPGKSAFPFHLHHANEEMIYILEGEGTLRFGKEESSVSAGTFIAFPPGADHPHQLINASERDLKYLCVGTMEYPDITEYPDSNKIGALTSAPQDPGFRAFYRKNSNLLYYDGENGGEIERVKKSKNRT